MEKHQCLRLGYCLIPEVAELVRSKSSQGHLKRSGVEIDADRRRARAEEAPLPRPKHSLTPQELWSCAPAANQRASRAKWALLLRRVVAGCAKVGGTMEGG